MDPRKFSSTRDYESYLKSRLSPQKKTSRNHAPHAPQWMRNTVENTMRTTAKYEEASITRSFMKKVLNDWKRYNFTQKMREDKIEMEISCKHQQYLQSQNMRCWKIAFQALSLHDHVIRNRMKRALLVWQQLFRESDTMVYAAMDFFNTQALYRGIYALIKNARKKQKRIKRQLQFYKACRHSDMSLCHIIFEAWAKLSKRVQVEKKFVSEHEVRMDRINALVNRLETKQTDVCVEGRNGGGRDDVLKQGRSRQVNGAGKHKVTSSSRKANVNMIAESKGSPLSLRGSKAFKGFKDNKSSPSNGRIHERGSSSYARERERVSDSKRTFDDNENENADELDVDEGQYVDEDDEYEDSCEVPNTPPPPYTEITRHPYIHRPVQGVDVRTGSAMGVHVDDTHTNDDTFERLARIGLEAGLGLRQNGQTHTGGGSQQREKVAVPMSTLQADFGALSINNGRLPKPASPSVAKKGPNAQPKASRHSVRRPSNQKAREDGGGEREATEKLSKESSSHAGRHPDNASAGRPILRDRETSSESARKASSARRDTGSIHDRSHSSNGTKRNSQATSMRIGARDKDEEEDQVNNAQAHMDGATLEERAAARRANLMKLRAQAKERVAKQKQEEEKRKMAQTIAEEEAFLQEREEKRAELERVRVRTAEAKAAKQALNRLTLKAENHYTKQLLIRRGLAPWIKLLSIGYLNEAKALEFRRDHLLLSSWNSLIGFSAGRRLERMRWEQRQSVIATHHYKINLMRSTWLRLKRSRKILRAKAASIHSHFNTFIPERRAFKAWVVSMEGSRRYVAQQMRRVSRRGDVCAKRFYISRWKEYMEIAFVEREIRDRSEAMFAKVQSWINHSMLSTAVSL